MKVHFARARSDCGRSRRTAVLAPLGALGVLAVSLALVLTGAPRASAAQAPVGLGTATSFAVLAGSTVTNTGPSTIGGDLGVSPGSAVTGFPPGTVTGGVIHAGDAVAAQAQSDLTTAYNDAAGRTPSTGESGDLTGQTLTAGVYKSTSSLGLTGTVTLDAQGDPDAVFIFQVASTLITGSGSDVSLINGAQPCNVFWQVGSSATLGTNTTFNGSILALTSISANTGATVAGRLLARNGAVTLDDNTITRPVCSTATSTATASPSTTATATSSTTPTGTPTGTATGTPTTTATGTPSGTATATGTPTTTATGTPTTTPTGSGSPTSTVSSTGTPSSTATGTPTTTGTASASSSASSTSSATSSASATSTGTSTLTGTSTSGAGSPSASSASPRGGTLPKTGVDLLPPAAAGAGLLTLGGAALASVRRSRRH
jgi:LPXTG-motif cell wall-anchored protein